VFGSEILEVGIGIVLVFLIVSVICAAIREGLELWLKTRSSYLEHGIRELLHDPRGVGLARQLYEHPLIYSLYSDGYEPGDTRTRPKLRAHMRTLPSYIPARSFALALMDIAARGPDPAVGSTGEAPMLDLASVRANVALIRNERVQRVLLTAIDTAQNDFDRAQKNVEEWYDASMDRVSGWYKRSTHLMLFLIGVVVAVALNINTIAIAEYLYIDDTARAAVVARAEAVTQDSGFVENFDAAMAQLDTLAHSVKLPIGWGHARSPAVRADTTGGMFSRAGVARGWEGAGKSFFGWLLTALAATMGAPFWFDLLNKMMVIRSTVKPKEKSPDEGSEDRQLQPATTVRAATSAPAAAPAAAPAGAAAASPGTAGPSSPATVAAGTPGAAEGSAQEHDGCDVAVMEITHDDELPPAEGGVA